MKNLMIVLLALAISSCGGSTEQTAEDDNKNRGLQGSDESSSPSCDPNRGEGKFTDVEVGSGLDATIAIAGEKVTNLKCASCHKMTEERLVGSGWKGVTERRNLFGQDV